MTTLLERPDTIFEVNFFNTQDGQSWTNLSDYVELQEGISISRRRQLIFDEVSAGTMGIYLDNSAGTFNNERSDLDFAGLINIDVPIRYRARWPRVPTDTVNMLSDDQSLASSADEFTAEQGSLDLATMTVLDLATFDDNALDGYSAYPAGSSVAVSNAWSNSAPYSLLLTTDGVASYPLTDKSITVTPGMVCQISAELYTPQGWNAVKFQADMYDSGNNYVTGYTGDPFTLAAGESGQFSSDLFDIPANVVTIHACIVLVGTPPATVQLYADDITVTGSTDVPSGQSTALSWSTGVLQATGLHVLTGDFNSRSADESLPVYVKPSTQYTAQVQVKCDAAGTGMSFQVSPSILWYDKHGALISESAGAAVTLTTSYQPITLTATSPATAYSARMGIANETTVNPVTPAIAITGYTSDHVNRGGRFTHLTLQRELNVGDFAVVWHHINSHPTLTAPVGWTQLDAWNDSRGKTAIYYKFLTQEDIGTVTEWKINQTGKRWVTMLTSYSGVNTANPIDNHVTDIETIFQTGHATPSITTTAANCWIISGVFDASSTTTVWTPPATGETTREAVYCIGGNAATGIVCDTNGPVASGVHAGEAFSANVKSKFAAMARVAIAPAAGTGPDSVEVWMGAWQFEQNSSASTWASGGHWKDLFTGLTDSWTKTWSGDLSLMAVQATDRSKQLNNNNVGSAVSETINHTNPVAYYVLNESGDVSTTEGANSAPTAQPAIKMVQIGSGGTLEWAGGTGPAVDGVAAVKITKVDRNNGQALRVTLDNPITDASEVTLMAWFASSDNTAQYGTIAKAVNVGLGTTEFGYCELRGFPGTDLEANSFVKSEVESDNAIAEDFTHYFDGKTHFACGVFTLDGGELTSTLYVDGVQTATNSIASTFTAFPPLTILEVGNAFPSNAVLSGTYSHVALVEGALDADTIANIYAAGTTAFAGDTVDERIGRICDWAGVDDLDIANSDTYCDRHMPDSQTALSAIQQAARTDGGTSFIGDNGKVTFRSRTEKESPISVWLTIDARRIDPGMTELTDDQLLVNQANIKRLGANSTQTSNNLDSQSAHGIYNKDIETIQQNPDDATYNGEYLTAFYAEPKQRCDSVTIQALFLNDWTTLLTQDMWDVIRITNLPSIEESSTLTLYIEGWEYKIDDQSWDITYDTSSAIAFGVLNDATQGLAGTGVVVAW